MDNTKVLLGFLGGLAVGAIAGILLAPDKGSETRKRISNMASDVTDAVEDGIHQALDKVKEKYSQAVHQGEELADKALSKMTDAKNDLSGRLS
ncbi:MAG: YtxH domain-containing protein [Chitinophagaceae bacterium]|jgi:gas vesicle protein|nr:YtxH domain-containing protein [Chitinophagaceae bacterium]